MDCHLCSRPYTTIRKLVCHSCAKANIHTGRVSHVDALNTREKAHAHAEAIARPGNDGVLASLPQDADWDAISNGVKAQAFSHLKAELERTSVRIAGIEEQAQLLRKRVEDYRQYAAGKKQESAKRRQEVVTERKELGLRKAQVLEPVQSAARKAARQLAKTQSRTVDARAYVCKYVTSLSGLHQVRDKLGKPTGHYTLHGLEVPNLKELVAADQEHGDEDETVHGEHHHYVNASFDNVCHLLGVWCTYLSVRLPAEIILRHPDFPHAAILPERSSYRGKETPYPGELSGHTSSSISRLTRVQRPSSQRARLLHLSRPLLTLEKDDRKVFALFLEGVVLLAWDIAWLCHSQGIPGITDFDSICNLGHNLYLLSRAQEASHNSRPSLDRRDTSATNTTNRSGKSAVDDTSAATVKRFGTFSHGSATNSLTSTKGAEYMSEWRKLQPHRLVDQLRQYMASEMTGTGWDMVSDHDLDDEGEDGVAVLIGDTPKETRVERGLEASAESGAIAATQGIGDRKANGWMKVRGRGSEA